MLPSSFPDADVFAPGRGEPALRWGVIGPGWIAGEFVGAVHRHTPQRFTAVASRSAERAAAFAAAHGIDAPLDSAEALVARDDVDVVYIASPQSEHLAQGLLAIMAGKHVLIEKPLATTAEDAAQLADAARRAGVMLMEAMWTRYLPQTSVLQRLVADGVLGDLRSVAADHGQAIPVDPNHRLYRPELGGGALLDLGIYPVQFASMLLGMPTGVTAVGGMTSTGVDAYSSLILTYPGIAQATLTTSMLTRTPTTAMVAGSDARVEFDSFFYTPQAFRLSGNEPFAPALEWTDPTGLTLFDALSYEATALARYVGEGRTESPLHTLDETVAILATIDDAVRQLRAG